jgi:PAS domain S-box-containing protein
MPPQHGMPKGHLPVRSYLAVPVKSRSGDVLGALFFGHPQPGVFTEQTEKIIAGIATQAAIAIDNARLYTSLQANERQLQFITDHAPVHLALLGRDCIYRFANHAYMSRFRKPMNEIIGHHVSEVIGPEAWETARHHIDQVLAGQDVSYEMEMQVGDLGPRWMSVVYVPERNADNHVVGFVAVSSDITSSKLAEREADRARDKVLAASRAKDDFLAALSHELRTPLNPVLLLASEAAENKSLPAEVRAEFAMIRKNVELEARLIDDLLDLTRITRGKLFLDLRSVDVHLVLRDALSAVKAPLEAKKIVLDLHFDAQPYAVLGDAVRLQQVFWNVLNNAVKFTPAHGHVEVATSVVPETSTIAIKVSDSGVGMTPQELGDIFTAFSQGEHAEDGGSHRFGGLGLGLAISRMLVEQHAGRIRAESAGRDQGASFIIELPLLDISAIDWKASPDSLDAETPENPWSSDKPTRVLLVEDHEATRAAIGILLQRRQFTVTGAASLAEALELARSERFDLLISDIGLPDGNGYDLMIELQKNHDMAGIALTGYGMENDIARSREAGFSAHLVKPVSVQDLEKAIAAAIG